MARKEILDRIQKYVNPFRITKGNGFRLKDFDPNDTCDLKIEKGEAAELLQRGTDWLAVEQDMLYAQNRWSLLLIFQAMDAAGKDSTIRHVIGRQSSGLPGLLVQAALVGGPRPRLHVALLEAAPRAGTDRHFQSVLLRGGPRRARA